jgi:hypothetical protein
MLDLVDEPFDQIAFLSPFVPRAAFNPSAA